MQKRNYGLDFLRIFAMVLVVLDHVVISNFIGGRNGLSVNNATLWLLYMVANWCNVIFGMVSGYLMFTKRPKANRVFGIWFETFFYSVLCMLFLILVFHVHFERKEILTAIFPIMRGRYWYLTAYFEMLLFVPFMNIIVRHITRNTALTTLSLFFIMVVLLPLIFSPRRNPFGLGSGKNAFALMLFYFMGAFIRKFKIDQIFTKKTWWKIIIATLIVGWGSKLILALGRVNYGWKINPNLLAKGSNVSPIALICAFAFFCIFKNVDFKAHWHKILKLFSAASLGVYLIHWAIYPVLQYQVMIPGRKNLNPFLLVIMVLIIAVLVDLICTMIDICRIYLFNFLHINQLNQVVGERFELMLAHWHKKFDALFAKNDLE